MNKAHNHSKHSMHSEVVVNEHKMGHDHQSHHAHMVADFKKRFWISLIIILPILTLSPMIQKFLHIGKALHFKGDLYVLFLLSPIAFFHGGYPFIKGLFSEPGKREPWMMTLIHVAITTAYLYSSAIMFGFGGNDNL